MIKMCGIIMLISGTAGLGFFASRKLGMRTKTLQSLLECLEMIEWELETNMPPTKQLFREVSVRVSAPASLFIIECMSKMESDEYSLSEMWNQAAEEQLTALKPEDLEVLLPVGAVLGRYDADSQRNAITAAHNRLDMHWKDSIAEKKRLGRLYNTLGVMVGIFLVIIFL